MEKDGNGASEREREREGAREKRMGNLRGMQNPVDAAAAAERDGRGRMDPLRSDHPEL